MNLSVKNISLKLIQPNFIYKQVKHKPAFQSLFGSTFLLQ